MSVGLYIQIFLSWHGFIKGLWFILYHLLVYLVVAATEEGKQTTLTGYIVTLVFGIVGSVATLITIYHCWKNVRESRIPIVVVQYRPIASIKQLNLMTSKAPISTVKQDGVSDTESTSSTHEENDNHTVTKSPEEPMDKKD